jgi:hypothetical protein
VYGNVVAPYLRSKGFDLTKRNIGANGQEITRVNTDARVSVMKKLGELGVPLESSGKFFAYMM